MAMRKPPGQGPEGSHSTTATASTSVASLAEIGIYVFPCIVKGRDKTPLVKWGTESTTDPDTIRSWWTRWPNASIGVDCGKSRLVIIDLDVKDGVDGPGNWKRLVNGRDVPATFYVRTPSGGWHLWFRDPAGKYRLSAGKVAAGVDVRAGGGFAVAPTSPGYTWHAEVPLSYDEIPVLPDGIIPVSTGGGTGHWSKLDRETLDPRDLACLEALEGLGGHSAYLSGEYVAVTRPGKIAGASASVGYVGPGMAKVFTPNWPPLHEGSIYDADHLAKLVAGDNGDGGTTAGRRVRLTPASTVEMRPVRWLWDTAPVDALPGNRQGRLPEGSLTVGVGRAGLGKSQFAVWLTARITTGTLPGVLYGKPRTVIYCASEDSWAMTIAPRLHAAGADLDLVFRAAVESDEDPHARLTLPRDTRALEDAIGSHSVALVALDPLLSLIDGRINDYRAREVREALEPLAAVADRTRATILGLAHFTKASGSDPLMLISGSAAFGQVIRAAVGFARDEDDNGGAYVLSTIKNNLGREDLPSLTYTIEAQPVDTPSGETWVSRLNFTGEESTRSVRDILSDRTDRDERTERDEAADWLRGYLTDEGGEASRKDVFKAGRSAGFSEATLKRARAKAGVSADRQGFGGGSVWRLANHSAHHSDHSAHTSTGEPNEPNGEPNGDMALGPCIRCQALTVRYGPNGNPLCVDCRAEREDDTLQW